jgi:hypothetical protein
MKYYTKPKIITFADATPTRTEHWIYRPGGTPIALCDDKDEAEAMTKGLNAFLKSKTLCLKTINCQCETCAGL